MTRKRKMNFSINREESPEKFERIERLIQKFGVSKTVMFREIYETGLEHFEAKFDEAELKDFWNV